MINKFYFVTDGVVGSFPLNSCSFKQLSDLVVRYTPIGGVYRVLVAGTHYSISGNSLTGSAVLTTIGAALAAGNLYVRRRTNPRQEVALSQLADQSFSKVETGLDDLARQISDIDSLLPTSNMPNTLWGFDVNGNPISVPASFTNALALDAAVALATTQAGVATTQAGVATTQAGLATTSAANAATSATIAQSAALASKYYPAAQTNLPRGAMGIGAITAGSGGTNGTFALAFTGGNFGTNPTGTFTVAGGLLTAVTLTGPGLYVGVAPTAPTLSFAASAGLTGAACPLVVDYRMGGGEFYWTDHLTDANFLALYYRSGTSAVATSPLILLSKANYASLLSAQACVLNPPLASGSLVSNSYAYFSPETICTFDRWLSQLEIGLAANSIVNAVVSSVDGGGNLSVISATALKLNAGAAIVSGLDIYVPAGAVCGVQAPIANSIYYVAGTIPNSAVQWYTTVVPTTATAKTISTINGPNVRFTLEGEVLHKSRHADATVASQGSIIGSAQTIGFSSPVVATGSDCPANYSILFPQKLTSADRIAQIVIGAHSSATSTRIIAMQMTGNTPGTVSAITVPLTAGQVNVIDVDVSGLTDCYIGVCDGFKYQGFANSDGIIVWTYSGLPISGTAMALSIAHRYEVQLMVKSGLQADANRALKDLTSATGLKLMDAADPLGIVDASAIFASAVSAHPAPFVRPGSFTVNALPPNNSGLYGPGKITSNGKRFFAPLTAKRTALLKSVQAAMAEHAYAGDVLAVVGDSKAHWSSASTGAKHWFNLLCQFLNFDIAVDDPIMTALRSSSTYTPAFYGVTFTGTVTTGTAGPILESAILAAGATMSFTGTYEQVDVWYTQQAGAGNLAFSYNGGAAYKTVTCAGSTDNEHYSGTSLTGQTASGTYTITASGGPVEITALLRLGVKSDATRKRFLFARFAHGSYTFASFGTAQRTAMAKICSFASGKMVPIIDLGVNDSFGTAPATIVTNATAHLTEYTAAGAPRILAMPPDRPSSAWAASYTGGNTYDAALGAIRRLYRQQGVKVIPTDMIDFLNTAKSADGVHYNDDGNDAKAAFIFEYLAALA